MRLFLGFLVLLVILVVLAVVLGGLSYYFTGTLLWGGIVTFILISIIAAKLPLIRKRRD